jgi:hypothetical protein
MGWDEGIVRGMYGDELDSEDEARQDSRADCAAVESNERAR